MTVVYHGTPITPLDTLYRMGGRHYCLTYFYRGKWRRDVMEPMAEGLMIDWGIFPAWKKGVDLTPEYRAGYIKWVDPLLDRPTTWAVIPDHIGAGTQELDALIKEWPHGYRGAPVYHLDAQMMQPVDRMLRLLDEWPRVCIGWAEKDLPIAGPDHARCMDILWNAIEKRHGRRTPTIHHFRGTQLVEHDWPLASVDSTDVARNHHRPQNNAVAMADRWDALNCPAVWTPRDPNPQLELIAP